MHHGMTWAKEYWPIALILINLLWMPAELVALFSNWSNTLSDWSRSELGIGSIALPFDQHTLVWIITLIAWVIVVGWLTWHIWFEVGFSV